MSDFRTKIDIQPGPFKLNYQTKSIFMGSCFSENIGEKMNSLKFPVLLNPFGVLYNPESIRNALDIIIDHHPFSEDDLYCYNNKWLSFYHDTSFSSESREHCYKHIKEKINESSKALKQAKYLFVTFGTAWVYRWEESGNIVSNCHKIPASQFERSRLSIEGIFVEWASLINRLLQFNSRLKIVFTVSPVRHWKDGAIENQLSKSTLIMAVHQIKKMFTGVDYFPAYEIMMDDLRDYRFYADDMVHPGNVAIDYIWNLFRKKYIDEIAVEISEKVNKLNQAINHRPFNVKSTDHQKFLKRELNKIHLLQQEYPFLDFEKEIQILQDQLQ